jgi:hypothetical protein
MMSKFPHFRRIAALSLLAGMVSLGTMAGTALTHSADAAVCTNGIYWDAFPVFVNSLGNCLSRMGWVGVFVGP